MSAASIQWINNAKDVPLNTNTGTLPDMADTLMDWFQPLVFGLITKTVSAFQLIETVTDINFHGIIQPLSGKQIAMKPEGQRQWNWIMVHSDLRLSLQIDDVVIFLGEQYRVQNKKNYSLYKYQYYELVQDYLNAGPPTP